MDAEFIADCAMAAIAGVFAGLLAAYLYNELLRTI